MANQNSNPYDKEIDFEHVSGKIKGIFTSLSDSFFDIILFIKRYFIVLIILFIIGAGLGYYKDMKAERTYESKLFLIPNFKSADYLYSQVELLNSKSGDKEFYEKVGIKDYKAIRKIEVEPVVDIYEFIKDPNDPKYMVLKLMADSGEIAKILEDKVTGKNYKYQVVTLTTSSPVTDEEILNPLMKFLNANPYLEVIKKEWVNNLEIEIAQNDTLIKQIDGILNNFGKKGSGGSAVFYNNEAPIHEVIKEKQKLIAKQGENRINRINFDRIIKDSSNTLNINKGSMLSGKKKFLFPILLILVFAGVISFIGYYKKQMNKRQ